MPLLLVARARACRMAFVGSTSTWLTLTLAGLAMGMIIFITASGLTLVFGLMDVLNFGHGVFIALGAFIATTVFAAMHDWTGLAQPGAQPRRGGRGNGRRDAAGERIGWAFERVLCGRCTASTSSRS
jgi:branched-chain amino acid transport system permease protein